MDNFECNRLPERFCLLWVRFDSDDPGAVSGAGRWNQPDHHRCHWPGSVWQRSSLIFGSIVYAAESSRKKSFQGLEYRRNSSIPSGNMVRPEFHHRFLVALLAVIFFINGTASARRVIKTIPEVRRLSTGEAAQQLPVLIDAQVLRIGPEERNLFIFAENKGVYVQRHGDLSMLKKVEVGDWIRIDGVTVPGEFVPAIVSQEVEVLRSEPLPVARPFRLEEIHAAASDCDWVSVEGRLTAVSREVTEHNRILLTLEMHESILLDIALPDSDEGWERIPEIMFRRVRFNAVVGTLYNSHRQLTGRIFIINSINDIELLEEAASVEDPESLPIHSLMRAEVDHRQTVKTRGIVTYASPREIFLRGDESSLRVAVLDAYGLRVGQIVQVEGYVWPQPISPAFRAWSVEVLEKTGSSPEPINIVLEELLGTGQPEDLLDPRMNYELVRIRAQLVDVGKSFGLSDDLVESGKQSLLCRSGSHLFEARLPTGMLVDGQLKPGAIIELTGICNLMQNKRLQWRLYFEGLWLQVRGEEDVVVVQPAPWWTPQRLLWISGAAFGLSALSLIWVVALRKTVGRQTGIIGKQIERETILDERQRIARELHDNLDQGLTGAAIRLQGCRKFLEAGFSNCLESIRMLIGQTRDANDTLRQELKDQLASVEEISVISRGDLKSVQDMLGYCGEESRSQIIDLRGGLLERMDLPAALREALTPLAAECGATLSIVTEGEPRRLQLVAERNLLLIARESAANAARHAVPSHIRVKLAFTADSLSLLIEDDGYGFPMDQLPLAGHFGLKGMRERAKQLGADIGIDSSPGEGTSVNVLLSSTAEWELE